MKRLIAVVAVVLLGAMSILAADRTAEVTYEIRLHLESEGKQLSSPTIVVTEGDLFTFEAGGVAKAPEGTGSDREFAIGTKMEGRMYRNGEKLYLDGRVSQANFVVTEGEKPGIRGTTAVVEMVEPITLGKEIEIKCGAVMVKMTAAEWTER